MMRKAVAAAVASIMLVAVSAADERSETARIAEQYGFAAEQVMPDGTRCDLVSDRYAIEVEWASKWKEAPGQATLYAIWTGKQPAIVLLTEGGDEDKVHLLRCRLVCERLGIALAVRRVQK